mmetsp:Transcript_8116/g.12428  ORF Transcript_8116/g.12428 Transcript_8116/m.12428 type:complete len:125 (-) Transcript_8116:314-688(-)
MCVVKHCIPQLSNKLSSVDSQSLLDNEMAKPKSTPIPIPVGFNKKTDQIEANDVESLKERYEWMTWQMYFRIWDHRNSDTTKKITESIPESEANDFCEKCKSFGTQTCLETCDGDSEMMFDLEL